MIGDPPDVLRDLIAAERTAPVVNEAMRTMVGAKLSSTLGIAPVATAASKLAVIKLLSIVLGVAGVVTTAAVATRDNEVAAAPVIAHVSSAPSEQPSVEVVPDPVVATPATVTRPKPAHIVAHRTQVELLAEATRALTDGDAQRVLALVDEDLRVHRDAPLAEEREALRLSALLALDRTTDARAAATRFLSRYPHTSHRALVDRALTTETP